MTYLSIIFVFIYLIQNFLFFMKGADGAKQQK